MGMHVYSIPAVLVVLYLFVTYLVGYTRPIGNYSVPYGCYLKTSIPLGHFIHAPELKEPQNRRHSG